MDLNEHPEILAYHSGVLTSAYSPVGPSGERMRLTIQLPDNAVRDRLMMQISEDEGERIAELLGDSNFAFRAEPEVVRQRERDADKSV
ncbi:MAG: hypothetical protein ACRDFX_03160 [Chloroflexota bacterium]